MFLWVLWVIVYLSICAFLGMTAVGATLVAPGHEPLTPPVNRCKSQNVCRGIPGNSAYSGANYRS